MLNRVYENTPPIQSVEGSTVDLDRNFRTLFSSMRFASGRSGNWSEDEKQEALDRITAKANLFSNYVSAAGATELQVDNQGFRFVYGNGNKVTPEKAIALQASMGEYAGNYFTQAEAPNGVSNFLTGFSADPQVYRERAKKVAEEFVAYNKSQGITTAESQQLADYEAFATSEGGGYENNIVKLTSGSEKLNNWGTAQRRYRINSLEGPIGDQVRAVADMFPEFSVEELQEMASETVQEIVERDRVVTQEPQQPTVRDKSQDQTFQLAPTGGRLSEIGGTVEQVEAAIEEKPFTPEQKARYDAAIAEGKNQIEAFALAIPREAEAAKEKTADDREYVGLSEEEIVKVKELEAEGKSTKEALREVALGDDDLTKRLAEADAKMETPKEEEKPVTMDEFNAAEKAALDKNKDAQVTIENEASAKGSDSRDNIFRSVLQREKDLGYDNFGFTSEPAGSIKTMEQALAKFKEVYGPQLNDIPENILSHSADQLFNSEDHRATLMVAAGVMTATEKSKMYKGGKLDIAAVEEKWNNGGKEKVMKMAEQSPTTFNNLIAKERKRSYANTNGADQYGKEWAGRVDQSSEVQKNIAGGGQVGGTADPKAKETTENKAAENKPFANKEEGDAFRAWMNKAHPDFKHKNQPIDATGEFDNEYIEAARKQFGDAYQAEKANPESSKNLPNTDPKAPQNFIGPPASTADQLPNEPTAQGGDSEWNKFDTVGVNTIEGLPKPDTSKTAGQGTQVYDPEAMFAKMMESYKQQDMKGVAENIFGMAKNMGMMIRGIGEIEKPDVEYTPSQYQDEMISEARRLKDVGIPESQMNYNRFLNKQALNADTENVRRNSGGNAGVFLGNRLAAVRQYWNANAGLIAEDKKVELAAMGPYIQALQSGEDTHRKMFEDKFTRDIERKRAAASMVGDAMVNMTNRAQMDRMYGPNSPNVLYQKSNMLQAYQEVLNRKLGWEEKIKFMKDPNYSPVTQSTQGVATQNGLNLGHDPNSQSNHGPNIYGGQGGQSGQGAQSGQGG